MRKIMMIAAVACLALAGCSPRTREQVDAAQREYTPHLVCKQDGVRLYRVYDVQANHWVFFTTPAGDVAWKIRGDDETPDKDYQVAGAKTR